MDLRQRLAKAAVGRASVLVVEVPGWARTRWAVERDVRRRGWRIAVSPADADLLVTCGRPEPRLADALDLVWAQLPGPRARVDVLAPTTIAAVLDEVAAQLLDDGRQRRGAADRPTEPEMGTPACSNSHSEDDGNAGEHGDMDMDMEPGGIPLAGGGGDDRDGLDLDVLHIPLGPVLPCWPAGLLLHCTLHGDVVAEARAEVLGAAPDATPEASSHSTPSDLLDRAARLLLLAGWDDAATAAARLRDELADTPAPRSSAAALDRLTRRVHRSRSLRWSLHGLGRIDPGFAREHGLGDGSAGDVRDRLLDCLAGARPALEGARSPASPVPVELLPELVTGLELSAVRLVVASLDLDTTAEHPHQVRSA